MRTSLPPTHYKTQDGAEIVRFLLLTAVRNQGPSRPNEAAMMRAYDLILAIDAELAVRGEEWPYAVKIGPDSYEGLMILFSRSDLPHWVRIDIPASDEDEISLHNGVSGGEVLITTDPLVSTLASAIVGFYGSEWNLMNNAPTP